MPANPADSALYRDLFGDDETARLLSDSAVLRAMLLVEGQLALVQGKLGLIPMEAAAYIDRAAREVVLDPSAMAAETARNGVPIPALLAAFRKEAQAPDMMQYLHWGATSQDIMDSAQALRLRRLCDLWDARLSALIGQLGSLAATNADLPMAARTYGQHATPTSFGAVVAAWGKPLLRHRARLAQARDGVAVLSLSGAAGTLAAMGAVGPQVRAGLAEALGLRDPGGSWHSERDQIAAFAACLAGICASLAKMGADLILLTQSGIGEVVIAGAGGSSTMPQKQNPVGPSVLVALSRQATALAGVMQDAAVHGLQRDGAAWFTEWLTLPQLCLTTGRALSLALDLAQKITPDAAAMARNLGGDGGLIHAEALTFALAAQMPRPDAAAAIKALTTEVRAGAGDLLTLAQGRWPGIDLSHSLGTAPEEARAFAARAQGQ